MEHKTKLTEANHMRKLMGLSLIKEEARSLKSEGHYIEEDGIDIGTGIEGNYADDKNKKDKDIAGAPESEEGLEKFDDDNIFEGDEFFDEEDDEGEDEEFFDEEDDEGEDDLEELAARTIAGVQQLASAAGVDLSPSVGDEEEIEGEIELIELPEGRKIKKGKKVIKLSEADLNKIVKRVIREDEDWMQDADEDIEKRGTEGVFHKFCVDNGFKDGCSKECWAKAKQKGGVWGRRAGLAKAFCESKH